ncbi:FadR family transcriptional regulator [Hyalangium sp.]|uniref:FadR family transcriptional regulator n=1 Tax=Hyalangium sp. TaxID=2028555 RepID=UPI0039C8667D
MPLDEALTLENLGVALRAEGPAHPERRRLLEGFLALKREMAVELLAACCEHASEIERNRLGDACFALLEAARWEAESRRWAQQEFELLRLAACAADRLGHVLLIQSLERAFWSIARQVLPHLDSAAIHQWAKCALYAVGERDAQALRRELPALLQAADDRLLSSLAPAHKADETPEAPHPVPELLHEENEVSESTKSELPKAPHAVPEPLHGENSAPESAKGELPGASSPNLYDCPTGLCQRRPAGGPQPESPATDSIHPRVREAARESHTPLSSSPRSDDDGRGRAPREAMGHGLDVVAIGVEHESSVVARAALVLTGPSVVSSAGIESGGVEAVQGLSIGRLEGQVDVSGQRLFRADVELIGPESSRALATQRDAQRLERSPVEAPARLEVTDLHVDVIE